MPKPQRTASGLCVRTTVTILIERAPIQVEIVIIATRRRARPNVVRIAITGSRALTATSQIVTPE